MKKSIAIIGVAIGIFCVVLIYYGLNVPNKEIQVIPNPASSYCRGLGYQFNIIPKTQEGICTFPDGSQCDAWDFFEGKCGTNHSYCEKHGGNIITTTKNCPFSKECAACILSDGTVCNEWDYLKGMCS
ncbi:MAG: DUF333 domain-containing protein [Methanoregula sp.]|jgi:putative hemolysin|uniref:DUF333 domain-containing protein n=1 Tax=Methanoregula sp. TaxID=2052170 RepID=UPI003C17DFDE